MSKNKSIVLTLFVMLLWGSLYPMVKLSYTAYDIVGVGDILLFAGIRFTVCGSAICLYELWRDKTALKETKNSLFPILGSGFFAIILHYGFTYTALGLADSSKTAIIKQIGALLYVCFSFLFFKDDKPNAKKLIGAFVGFLGIVVINYDGNAVRFSIGDLLVIGASLCTVFSNVISKKALKKVDPIPMTGVAQLFGGIVLLVVGILLDGSMSFSLDKWYIFAYICAASTIGYCVWFSVVKTTALSNLFIIKFAEPIFACLFSAVLLGENIFKFQYLIAFVFISLGIVMTNIKKNAS